MQESMIIKNKKRNKNNNVNNEFVPSINLHQDDDNKKHQNKNVVRSTKIFPQLGSENNDKEQNQKLKNNVNNKSVLSINPNQDTNNNKNKNEVLNMNRHTPQISPRVNDNKKQKRNKKDNVNNKSIPSIDPNNKQSKKRKINADAQVNMKKKKLIENGLTTINKTAIIKIKPDIPETKNVDDDGDDDFLNVSESKDDNNVDLQTVNDDTIDEVLLSVENKKFNASLKKDDKEELLFTESEHERNARKQRIRKILLTKKNLMSSNRNLINTSSNGLRQRMLERLKAAQFRYLNEKLYTSSGSEAKQLFQADPNAFHTYHEGYQQQVKKWPVNPLNVIIKKIQKMPKTHLIADMGCGEAALSKRLPHTVRSFDLVATAPGVEVCDIAHTPLQSASMDVAVYSLALMGTDLTQYLVEANRVLKMGGHLLIAEVESRFDNVDAFTKEVQRLGFKLKLLDKSHKVFFFMEFTKIRDPPVKKSKLPALTLKPCLYKRR